MYRLVASWYLCAMAIFLTLPSKSKLQGSNFKPPASIACWIEVSHCHACCHSCWSTFLVTSFCIQLENCACIWQSCNLAHISSPWMQLCKHHLWHIITMTLSLIGCLSSLIFIISPCPTTQYPYFFMPSSKKMVKMEEQKATLHHHFIIKWWIW